MIKRNTLPPKPTSFAIDDVDFLTFSLSVFWHSFEIGAIQTNDLFIMCISEPV